MAALKPEYREADGFIAEVIRTDRKKTADIRLDEGAVSVVVPRDLPVERIDALLKEKRQWIKNKLALHRQAQPVSEKSFVSGEAFPYLGRNYRLKVYDGAFTPVKLSGGYLHASVPGGSHSPHMVRNAVIRWYKAKAESRFSEKVARLAPQVGVAPSSVGVRSYSSRWGSCTAKGDVVLNWRVVMAPNPVCEYVVLHELCHLLHYDHSDAFWSTLARHDPHWREHKVWLKEHGRTLIF